jgi:hypothetical protein
MGVTIHFKGQLRDEDAYLRVINAATSFATERGWPSEPIKSEQIKLLRVTDDEQDWDYVGPVKGIALYPGEDCEPVRLEFDAELYMQEHTKTQFAGVTTHVQVLNLFKAIKPLFRDLKVEDEHKYWVTGDVRILSEHMNRIQEVIDEELAKNPRARAKIKTPSGRIVDLMT